MILFSFRVLNSVLGIGFWPKDGKRSQTSLILWDWRCPLIRNIVIASYCRPAGWTYSIALGQAGLYLFVTYTISCVLSLSWLLSAHLPDLVDSCRSAFCWEPTPQKCLFLLLTLPPFSILCSDVRNGFSLCRSGSSTSRDTFRLRI